MGKAYPYRESLLMGSNNGSTAISSISSYRIRVLSPLFRVRAARLLPTGQDRPHSSAITSLTIIDPIFLG